jgi:hypothetical protein
MSEGFYPLESILLVLALMALGRVPSLEALRYEAPGEWGKLMGLDRIPEVRTLRQKITELCAEQGRAQGWSSALAKQWMAEEPESAGVARLNAKSSFFGERIPIGAGRCMSSKVATLSFIEAGSSIYAQADYVAKELGRSRNLVFANALRFNCKNLTSKCTSLRLTCNRQWRIR